MVPNSAAMAIAIMTIAMVKFLFSNVLRSSSAPSVFCSAIWRSTNTSIETTPIPSGTQAGMAFGSAGRPILLSP